MVHDVVLRTIGLLQFLNRHRSISWSHCLPLLHLCLLFWLLLLLQLLVPIDTLLISGLLAHDVVMRTWSLLKRINRSSSGTLQMLRTDIFFNNVLYYVGFKTFPIDLLLSVLDWRSRKSSRKQDPHRSKHMKHMSLAMSL